MEVYGWEDEIRERMGAELGEGDGDDVEAAVRQFRTLMRPQFHLDSDGEILDALDDGEFVRRFLRVAKYDQDKAATRFVKYFEFQREEEFPSARAGYHRRDLPWLTNAYESGAFFLLPVPLADGSFVVLLRASAIDKTRVPIIDVHRSFWLGMERILAGNDRVQVGGVRMVQDMVDGPGLGTFGRKDMKRGSGMFQYVVPIRMKGVGMFRPPWYFGLMFKLIRPFLSQKTLDRMSVMGHSVHDDLHAYLPPEYLPEGMADWEGLLPRYSPEEELAAIYQSVGEVYFGKDRMTLTCTQALPPKWAKSGQLSVSCSVPGYVVVDSVSPGGAFDGGFPQSALPLWEGDLIESINGKPVRKESDVVFKPKSGALVVVISRPRTTPFHRTMLFPGIDIPWNEWSGDIRDLFLAPDQDPIHGVSAQPSDVEVESEGSFVADEKKKRRRRRRRRRRRDGSRRRRRKRRSGGDGGNGGDSGDGGGDDDDHTMSGWWSSSDHFYSFILDDQLSLSSSS